jgi:hypothetical protein
LNLKIRGVHFIANLIVFDSKGNGITLGRLVKQAQDSHRRAEKSMKITTLNRKQSEFVADPVVTAKGAANCAKLNQLDAS